MTTSDREADAEVIDLAAWREVPETQLVLDERKTRCAHRGLRLDPDARAVSCKRCGATLEAFDALANFAKWWDGYTKTARLASHAAERMERLRVEETRLRARLSRLRTSVRREQAAHLGLSLALRIMATTYRVANEAVAGTERAVLDKIRDALVPALNSERDAVLVEMGLEAGDEKEPDSWTAFIR